jgi:hypothetical protein
VGANPTSTLTLSHAGTPGVANFNFGPGVGIQYNGNTASQILTTRITLTSAQLLALNTTPIQILPSLGGNLSYAIIASLAHYRFNTTGYTGGSKFYLSSNNGYVANSGSWDLLNNGGLMLAAVADRMMPGYALGSTLAAPLGENVTGLAMYIVSSTALTLGDGTLTIELQYRIYDASLT